ncbi:MAG: DUF3467 domain-containing protein [Ignavibacteriales bacterium]|nr:DUF3467 domain-containing protein [Ignavibacteriales bacterium]
MSDQPNGGPKKTPNPRELNVELGEEQAQGTYANLAIITHSPAEFIIDFTRAMPNVPKAKVQSRIIMTPLHAKMLLKALQENVGKYESRFGEIKVDQQGGNPFGFDAKEPPDAQVN